MTLCQNPLVKTSNGNLFHGGMAQSVEHIVHMLHKYPNVIPIPGSKNQGRILENLGAWNVSLTDSEFTELEKALNAIPVHGHRGFVQYEGSKISDWGKK